MARFVILEHDHPILHWDLMLEDGSALRTWRLEALPLEDGGPIAATAIGDHRRSYLDYEGPVSGDRGQVKRCHAGTYEVLSRGDDRLELRFKGGGLIGTALLERVEDESWSFQFFAGS